MAPSKPLTISDSSSALKKRKRTAGAAQSAPQPSARAASPVSDEDEEEFVPQINLEESSNDGEDDEDDDDDNYDAEAGPSSSRLVDDEAEEIEGESQSDAGSEDSYLLEDSDFLSDENGDESPNTDEDNAKEGNSEEFEDVKTGPKGKTVVSRLTGRPKRVYPEIEPNYDSDSSTEEDPNRVGNIPMHWYDDLPHIGYDMNGKKVLRPAVGDELDKFLSTADDPSSWNKAFDKLTQSEQELSPEELDIIRRLQAAENPDASYDPYEPTVEWFTGKGKEEIMPISARPEPKRRWLPSKWEKQKVMKIVRAIRAGRIVPRKPHTEKPPVYELWGTDTSAHPPPLTAPKVALPSHSESYNPPPEYLPTPDEKGAWEAADKEDREQNYLPQKFDSLRQVPGYDQFIQERFSRLLDLYLAPRLERKKLNIDPDSLLPKLPSPDTLKPFPTFEMTRKVGDGTFIRSISISPNGLWAACGQEDGYVRLWELPVGREAATWKLGGKVASVAWCPRDDVDFLVAGTDSALHVLVPPYLPPAKLNRTLKTLRPDDPPPPVPDAKVKWSLPSATLTPGKHSSFAESTVTITMPVASGLIKQVVWHKRGDYFATVDERGSVWIHQISKRHSQSPFKTVKGATQCVLFHPLRPHFYVATQRYIRIYDLAGQKLVKTLKSGMKWVSSLDLHPSGDHLIVGGYDRKLTWFDLELSEKPHKVLKYHSRAIRAVTFHPKYPLFATCSDDCSIQIFHARVFADYMSDPLIVPLKILRGHKLTKGLGILDIQWCRNQPWLMSAGADGDIVTWAN